MIEIIQSVAPTQTVDRWHLDRHVKESFERTTGIFFTRHSDRTSTALATAAAKKALEFTAITSIRYLIIVTQSPDRMSPPMAVSLLDALQLPPGVMCFDVNQACCGYIYGLHLANSLLLAGGDATARALVVTVDKLRLDKSDTEKLIFSDAATATVVSCNLNDSPLFVNEPSGQDHLHMGTDHVMHMNGNRVFEYVTEHVPNIVRLMPPADYLIQHQANAMMMRLVAKRAGYKDAQSLSSIEKYGNTSMNSIPLTLCHNAEKFEAKEKSVLLCGYGAGWSMGLLRTTIKPQTILGVTLI